MGNVIKGQSESSNRDSLFFDAALLVIEQQEATLDLLKRKFNINDDRAEKILTELEAEGVVSSLLDNNTRDVEMTYEEFSLIFNYKKSTKPIDEKVARASNKTEQGNKTERKQQKGNIPLWFKLLVLAIIILLAYLLTQRYAFFTSTRFNKSMSEEKKGWVKNGNNWNYYDADGKQLSKCIVDDGGKYYYFDDFGNLAVERWVDYNGKTFYVNKDGVMLKNQWVGEYYVGNDGNILKDTITPDGYKVGPDGRYIQYVQPQTITIRETVPVIISIPEETTVSMNLPEYSMPSVEPIKIVDSEYGNSIFEPTASTQVSSNVINNVNEVRSEKTYNYTLESVENYNERTYLSNDKTCTINILIPKLVDREGNVCLPFAEEMIKAQDNIVSELIDFADYAIEDSDDSFGYFSTKYISSISFSEARITAQDDYSLVIREVGKCNWNKGKDTKIRLIIDYDKVAKSLSYYIEE